ncbi:MAG TPA: hypothetical protein VHH73_16475, partial [Verrucomicrobiae bacterium]|nr:hypothetical protein [Verrucomicrobiae bacterium]
MKSAYLRLLTFLLAAGAAHGQPIQGEPPSLFPQNSGYAYTRTGVASGVYKINDQVAVFPGSRYGFVKGYRVALDDADPLHAEAVTQDGQVYVPASFAGYLTLKDAKPDAAPPALRDRWVYHIAHPAYTPPPSVRTIQVNGKTYVNFADAGKALGLHVYEDKNGLACAGEKEDFGYTTHESSLLESTVSAFDTPEKFADPKLALKYLPQLETRAPAPKAPAIPKTAYNLGGFSFKMLGG